MTNTTTSLACATYANSYNLCSGSVSGVLDLGLIGVGDTFELDYIVNARARADMIGTEDTPGYARAYNAGSCFPFCNSALRLEPVEASIIPEPENWTLMLLGFGTLGTALRRRRIHTIN
ncbi:PEP-CTERM sorting domain-containing protein [Sphingomonas sp. AP4-R1]|nr:PEP-CTERM sorting domain-containing protein [Sphingomonas sp. AP4-R1]